MCFDVIGFRRLGHNEGDEPSYTQPLMYARVKAHPGVRAVYAQRLVAEGVVTEEEVEQMTREAVERYERSHARAKEIVAQKVPLKELPPAEPEEDGSDIVETGVAAEVIRDIAHRIAVVPEGFNINPKMVSQLARRAKMGEGAGASGLGLRRADGLRLARRWRARACACRVRTRGAAPSHNATPSSTTRGRGGRGRRSPR